MKPDGRYLRFIARIFRDDGSHRECEFLESENAILWCREQIMPTDRGWLVLDKLSPCGRGLSIIAGAL